MSKYTDDFKLAVVQHYLSGRGGYSQTAQCFQLDESTVRLWVSLYQHHGIDGIRRRKNKAVYTPEFKHQAVMSVLSGQFSTRQSIARLNIPGRGTLATWLQQYQKYGIDGLKPRPKGRPSMSKTPRKNVSGKITPTASESDALKALMEENTLLRAELDYLKKLSALIREEERRRKKP